MRTKVIIEIVNNLKEKLSADQCESLKIVLRTVLERYDITESVGVMLMMGTKITRHSWNVSSQNGKMKDYRKRLLKIIGCTFTFYSKI